MLRWPSAVSVSAAALPPAAEQAFATRGDPSSDAADRFAGRWRRPWGSRQALRGWSRSRGLDHRAHLRRPAAGAVPAASCVHCLRQVACTSRRHVVASAIIARARATRSKAMPRRRQPCTNHAPALFRNHPSGSPHRIGGAHLHTACCAACSSATLITGLAPRPPRGAHPTAARVLLRGRETQRSSAETVDCSPHG